jgi:hypothetical protein
VAALLTSVALAVRVSVGEPPVPVTVKTKDPAAVLEATVRVSVEEAAVAGLGLKAPVVPAGRPETDRVTAAVKPPVRVMSTVYVAVPPVLGTLTEGGVTEMEKSGVVTTRETVVERTSEPLVPVIVTA